MAEPAEVDQQLKKHRMMLPNALRSIVLPSCLTISMSPMDRSAAAIFRCARIRPLSFELGGLFLSSLETRVSTAFACSV